MRLSTKFILLVTGTIAIPFVAIFMVVQMTMGDFVDRIGLGDQLNGRNFPRLLSRLSALTAAAAGPDEARDILAAALPDSPVLVFDRDRRLVYSSIPSASFPASSDDRSIRFTFYRIEPAAGADYTARVGILSRDQGLGPYRGLAFITVFSSVLGFMTLMSIFIIRSINSSISRLEEATRRISKGDLDFKLEARGTDRIASLTSSFDFMRRRVKEEATARARFVLAISHDLKTPLSSIVGYVDAIREGMASDPGQIDKYLSIIRDKTGVLEGRISQLIDFMHQETGEWKQSRENLSLAPLLDEAVTVFETEAQARGFTFVASISDCQDVILPMDGDLVFRALENLVHNAFRHAEAGSTIEVRSERRADILAIEILNRGEAIAEKDLPFLFEPFYRGDRSRRETGFGLGLSVVKSVLASHGWDISVRSAGGETRFTIEIPMTV